MKNTFIREHWSGDGTPKRKLTMRAQKSVKKGTRFRNDGGGSDGSEAGRQEWCGPSSEKYNSPLISCVLR